MTKVAVIGQALADEVYFGHDEVSSFTEGNRKPTRIGGKAYNIAVAAKRLGASVDLVTAVGTDHIGKDIRKSLEEEGIGTRYVTTCSRGKSHFVRSPVARLTEGRYGERYVNVEFDRSILECYSAACESYANDEGAGHDVLIVTLEFGEKGYIDIANCIHSFRSRSSGIAICNPAPAVSRSTSNLHRVLSKVNGITPNRYEARALLSKTDGTAGWSPGHCKELVEDYSLDWCSMTLGASGWIFADNTGDELNGDAYRTELVDKVGASDVFTAALSLALHNGVAYRNANAFAAIVAGMSVSRPGGASQFPTRKEVLSTNWKDESLEKAIKKAVFQHV